MKKNNVFILFTIIYWYMFGLGYLMAKFLYLKYPRYYIFDIDKGFLLVSLMYLTIGLGYITAPKIKLKIARVSSNIRFDSTTSSYISLIIGFTLFFERILKLKFMPYWIYGDVLTFDESGYVGIGLLTLSISLGIDMLVKRKNIFIKLSIFFKIIILILYARSRGAIIWAPLIYFYIRAINKDFKGKTVKLVLPIIILTLSFLAYRFYASYNLSPDLTMFNLFIDIAPEFKTFNHFVELVIKTPINYDGFRVELFSSYFLDLLPDNVLNIVGINKYDNLFRDIGNYNHVLLYNGGYSGVRITIFQDLVIFANGINISFFILCIIFGFFIKYTETDDNSSIFKILIAINLSLSLFYHMKIFFFRIYPIIIISIIYNSFKYKNEKEKLHN
ncbi:MAG: hypothetical protein RBQ97_08135 [Acholeplasma sp.]|nr:hypothetical protein [Acholeplasma sp.]